MRGYGIAVGALLASGLDVLRPRLRETRVVSGGPKTYRVGASKYRPHQGERERARRRRQTERAA